jgi:hypothetical protein
MAYRRYQRNYSNPTPRNIEVKYAGPCACCGSTIKVGELATYYPAGTIAGVAEGRLAHMGGLEGTSIKCSNVLRAQYIADRNINDFAGDGLDARYEDDCAARCGL